MSQPSPKPQPSRGPWKKLCFSANGPAVNIWQKSRETANGPRLYRMVTVTGGRYRDESNQWRDAPLKPEDVGAVLYLLAEAQKILLAVPIPSADNEDVADEPTV